MYQTLTPTLINQYFYCPRRFFLMAIEQSFESNIYTIEGKDQHSATDKFKIEKRGDTIKVTAFHINSKKLNINGICDTIYFYRNPLGTYIPFLKDNFIIEPVEYKHGKTRHEEEYELQLATQIICLEEMFNTHISKGYLYYQNSNTKVEIEITESLRQKVLNIIEEINKAYNSLSTIAPEYKKRCKYCSMYDICNPKQFAINTYLNEIRKDLFTDETNSKNSVCIQ